MYQAKKDILIYTMFENSSFYVVNVVNFLSTQCQLFKKASSWLLKSEIVWSADRSNITVLIKDYKTHYELNAGIASRQIKKKTRRGVWG